jgi:hypothetical protein
VLDDLLGLLLLFNWDHGLRNRLGLRRRGRVSAPLLALVGR